MVFSGTFAYAESNKPEQKIAKVTINEYLMIKELKNKSDSELQKMVFSAKDIGKIRNFDYAEELYRRSKLDDSILKNLGYTDEQISMLRAFSGTEEEIIALAATLNISAKTDSYYYSEANNRTYYRARFDWNWSTAPAVMMEDIIGIAWSEGMYIDQSPNATYHRVKYVNNIYGNYYYENAAIEPIAPGGGAETKFDMCKMYGQDRQ
ncbi:hypothetical protein [Thermovenabulum gondwanense]|uniref:Uncharacterized protein n=1 Tax=Thermovenabulum gondwanense TaxID=520767 RepID=A0A162MYM4_9FIRM|nr:hypothetical protein [Thermovenabulum gondwanense]KYO68562.1 hypothetical protein ATZ99_00710 [Thermovenabulum gondwanense]